MATPDAHVETLAGAPARLVPSAPASLVLVRAGGAVGRPHRLGDVRRRHAEDDAQARATGYAGTASASASITPEALDATAKHRATLAAGEVPRPTSPTVGETAARWLRENARVWRGIVQGTGDAADLLDAAPDGATGEPLAVRVLDRFGRPLATARFTDRAPLNDPRDRDVAVFYNGASRTGADADADATAEHVNGTAPDRWPSPERPALAYAERETVGPDGVVPHDGPTGPYSGGSAAAHDRMRELCRAIHDLDREHGPVPYTSNPEHGAPNGGDLSLMFGGMERSGGISWTPTADGGKTYVGSELYLTPGFDDSGHLPYQITREDGDLGPVGDLGEGLMTGEPERDAVTLRALVAVLGARFAEDLAPPAPASGIAPEAAPTARALALLARDLVRTYDASTDAGREAWAAAQHGTGVPSLDDLVASLDALADGLATATEADETTHNAPTPGALLDRAAREARRNE